VFKLQSRGSLKAVLLSGAAFAAAYSVAAPAFADEAVETVVVTGSRIQTTNLTSPSPVSVTTAEQIQMTKATNLQDVLTKMIGPDVAGGISENSNNGGVGDSVIGLRNLGPPRTLVLEDSQRVLPVFIGAISAPDLNAIPLSMVDHIEVLRDGASSVYGAGAIGGVINIITKKDFSGLQIDLYGGDSEHGGGATYSLSGTMGANFDKGNVTFNATHDWTGAVGGWQRDWSTATHMENGGHGSSYRFQNDFLENASFTDAYVGNGVTGARFSSNTPQNLPCSTYFPNFYNGYNLLNANCKSQYGDWNTLQGSLDRTQLSANGHYDITNNVTFVLQGSFTDRRSEQLLRPEPLLGTQIATTSDGGATIFPGFLVPMDVHWGYPGGAVNPGTACPSNPGVHCVVGELVPLQFGPRDYKQTSDTYRIRAGLEGHLWGDYKWEIGYVQQRNNTELQVANSGNFLHLAEMLGELPCVDVPGGCTTGVAGWGGMSVPSTPVNFFAGPVNMSQDQLNYLRYTSQNTQQSVENFAYADISGPLFDLPAGKIEGSLGAERRWEHDTNQPDALVQDGYGANRTNPTSGGYGVYSVYGELAIPVFKNEPFAQSLEIHPSARYDHFSNFGDATTWKIGAEWVVTDDIRFRGAYDTNFREPSVAELFGGTGVSYLGVAGDPCDSRTVINGNTNMPHTGAEATARLAPGTTCYAQLAALGYTAGQIATYQSPENSLSKDQRGFLIGGNPTLKPEKAHQWTAGFVLSPHWVPGLSFAADYYEVTVTNAIIGGFPLSIGQDTFLQDAFASTGQNFQYANLVTRTKTAGIQQIVSTNANFGINKVTGLDMELGYNNDWASLGIGLPGSFSFNTQVSRQFQNYVTNPDGSVTNFLATFNSGSEVLQPRWKGTMALDWNFGGWALHWDLDWIGNTHNLDGSPDSHGNEIPDYFYHNISAGYELGGLFKDEGVLVSNSRLIVGVDNLFDKDPPYISSDSVCKCNTLAGQQIDLMGRFFYMRITTKL
jgi:iron complex outermembrane receptor protein